MFFSPKVKDRSSLVAHRRKFFEHCFLCECEKGCQPLRCGQEMMRINIVADSTGTIATITISASNINLFHSFYNPLKFIYHYDSSFKYEDREMERVKPCSSTQKETANGEGRAYSQAAWFLCPPSEPLC